MSIDIAPRSIIDAPPIELTHQLSAVPPVTEGSVLPPEAQSGMLREANGRSEAEGMVRHERILCLGSIGVGAELELCGDDHAIYVFERTPSQGDGFSWLFKPADAPNERGNLLVVRANPKGGQPTAEYHRVIMRRGDGLYFVSEQYRPTEPGASPSNTRVIFWPNTRRTGVSYNFPRVRAVN
ncbi:MAG TPA: hypothetical protein VJP80_03095 [Candidatus Saccharimonadales bacterium]|nr:hypothetical protein [Candidatus Saccharimonadales bacterium]